jgi:alpha-maltose-1-phosphate synthase
MLAVLASDRILADWITPSTIFHGITGSSLLCLRTAKRQGALTLVDNASRHPQHWKEAEQEEFRRFGVNNGDGSGDVGERMMRRREQEFQFCDRIVVPSAVARQSFAEMGYGDKTEVVPIGVDSDFFVPKRSSSSSVFRVCFVGRVELAKGVGDLLQAWKRLALPGSELLLVGAVRAHAKAILRTQADSSIRLTGFLPPQLVAQCYQESTLFVLASPNEGLAQVLLEAMACGLPVVASDMSGASECVTEGKEGFIVPTRNVDRLAEAIFWCYQHRDELPVMGQAARARIEGNFTLEHYNQRMIALYRKLAGGV